MKLGLNGVLVCGLLLMAWACGPSVSSENELKVYGAMHEAMHGGKIAGVVRLDTVARNAKVYGLGPGEFIRGELLIWEGHVYMASINEGGQMEVKENPTAKAPFFVATEIENWEMVELPDSVNELTALEKFLTQRSGSSEGPFAFKLLGTMKKAEVHVVNLPLGSKVRKPEDAHIGQQNFEFENEEAVVLGFFSKVHQGIFTHHDRFVHAHWMSRDKQKLGHLEGLSFSPERVELWIQK